ncbi:Polyribonucleotide nucleotidyltransferase 1, mitochondrial [Hondaea fermentalgiana]|uniref:Polyribonucleotide nucleotidyltransferase 1, mitochondrial n=1 Tax=Hondaea fermentalgiana TaxID=2315210 RepID=A0A2R5GDL9_9STRA|nr:Polyribonucleotide nucleotidyltransferase 1, mitochondrial [Hondaea fermentalgiana]|eukprot:GBG26291.1 Polyribonucleotide nucleotidyltransferase 1, mitochondrial [Hondaea fermentalgiana]
MLASAVALAAAATASVRVRPGLARRLASTASSVAADGSVHVCASATPGGGGTAPLELRALQPALGARATGAVVAQQGDTIVHATCVVDEAPEEAVDFAPITVVYREKAFAAGKIARTFTRREFAGKENEILAARAIDRSLRPLFPEGLQNAVQIICTVWAADGRHDPEILAINAASAATALAKIPWDGPLGAARVTSLTDPSQRLLMEVENGAESDTRRPEQGAGDSLDRESTEICINSASPEHQDAARSWLNLTVAGTGASDKVVMLEGSARELSPEAMVAAVDYAQPEIQASVAAQMALVETVADAAPSARQEKFKVTSLNPSQEMRDLARKIAEELVHVIFTVPHKTKQERGKAQVAFWKVASERLKAVCASADFADAGDESMQNIALHDVLRDGIARAALGKTHGRPLRIDGRGTMELRPIDADVDVLPSAHGSAVFSRGGTQVVCTATVGPAKLQKAMHPTLGESRRTRAMLQYDFPPYSVNRTGRTSGMNRRMVGHGNLAERGVLPILAPVLHGEETYPFAIHIGSEVTSSDGSSSMATTSGASLALMDAGVPITRPAVGVSVGLFVDPDDASSFCTPVDILGLEDHFGGMDFKVCGTAQGLTALQVDIKRSFITKDMLRMALCRGHEAHIDLIDAMCSSAGMREPRPALKSNHWSIDRVHYPQDVLSHQDIDTLRDIEDSTDVYLELDEAARALTIFAPTHQRSASVRRILERKGFVA